MFFDQDAYDRFKLNKDEFALLKKKKTKTRKPQRKTQVSKYLHRQKDGNQTLKDWITEKSGLLSTQAISLITYLAAMERIILHSAHGKRI
jgi:hypothetical protein